MVGALVSPVKVGAKEGAEEGDWVGAGVGKGVGGPGSTGAEVGDSLLVTSSMACVVKEQAKKR